MVACRTLKRRKVGNRFAAFRANAKAAIRRVKAKIRHMALTTVPMILSGGKLRKTKSVSRIDLVERTVGFDHLPDALDGLRVTHLTDLHIGTLIQPDRLQGIVDITNNFGGDLIAVTGDFVDLSLKVLDQVIDAMAQLKAPLGVYFVPGNHDYLDNGPRLIDAFRAAKLRMLMNESETLERDGRRIVVSGIDFPHKKKEMKTYVQQAMHQAPRRKPDDLRILLSHHPNAFDVAVNHHVDLTLAGHTHGGQVVVTNRGKKGSIGLGSIAHRYPRGLYQRGNAFLYVNSGVGSWFPLRVKCPAEVACITVRCAPEPMDEA